MPKLTSNVEVDGKWYGPDYPNAGDPPADKVTNEAAYAENPEQGGASVIDLRFTAADFGVEPGKVPHLGSDPATGTEHAAELKDATVEQAAAPKRGRREASEAPKSDKR